MMKLAHALSCRLLFDNAHRLYFLTNALGVDVIDVIEQGWMTFEDDPPLHSHSHSLAALASALVLAFLSS